MCVNNINYINIIIFGFENATIVQNMLDTGKFLVNLIMFCTLC